MPSYTLSAEINNTSGVTGVSFNKNSGKYMAYISINGKCTFFPETDTLEEAYQIRKSAEEKYYKV